jgi:hypothetical protein
MIGWDTVLIAQAAFALGYLCGKIGALTRPVKDEPKGFFAQNTVKPRKPDASDSPRQAVDIDERKIVSQINTDTMQKVTQVELGTKTAVADDINASVNRLAQLKGK